MGKKWWVLGILMLAASLCRFGGMEKDADLPTFSQPEQTVAALATESRQEVEFPCVLRQTGLILQKLARYDGPFLEEEGKREVADTAALMVYNPGKQWIRSVKILVTQGKRDYLFEITYLPPNSRVLVLEKNGQRFSEEPVESCRCLSLSLSEFTLCPDQFHITETASGLLVENLTGQKISRLVVYYKQYASNGDFYLGGYTCQKEVLALAAGECREVDAYRYVPGYSRVVAVQWEE